MQSKDSGCKMFWPVKKTTEMADGPTTHRQGRVLVMFCLRINL